MNHERLGDLGTLYINSERTSNIDLEDIVDSYFRSQRKENNLELDCDYISES